jgi:hypothetical protein
MKTALSFILKGSHYPSDSDEALIWRCLLNNKSFQLSENANQDRWIGFRVLYHTLKRYFGSNKSFIRREKGSSLLLTNVHGNQERTLDYVERFTGESMSFVVMRANMTGHKRPYSVVDFLKFLFLSLRICFRCLFFPNARANWALIIKEIFEIDTVLWLVSNNGISKVFDFLPYEKDANLMSYLLRKENVEVCFIPSLNPLKDHNRIMIADKLVLVTPYQMEEYKRLFFNTIRCGSILKWPPEGAYSIVDRYQKMQEITPKFHLGFYSHGSWVRHKEGHIGSDHFMQQEEWVLSQLSKFLMQRSDLKILILLHPREKKLEPKEIMSYYEKFLGSRFELSPLEMKSAESFELVNVGVAAYSSIVYERLFCGFKMLFGGQPLDDFPILGSTLSEIFYKNYDEMIEKIIKALDQSNEQFIEEYHLEGYHYKSFNLARGEMKTTV